MTVFALPSLVGLLVQASGASLMATLGFVLLRHLRRVPLYYWSIGWTSLVVALVSLWLSFQQPALEAFAQPVYLFGEYLFGFMVFAGYRQYATGARIQRRERWLAAPAAALAIVLPRLGGFDFNVFFTLHTLVYAYMFFLAFRALRPAVPNDRTATGLKVSRIALLLLALDYAHYAPLFAMSSLGMAPLAVVYLEYGPLYDLMFLVMLMFGMLMLTTGEVQYELELSNARLAEAHRRLEQRARLDHLTSALNRHALHSVISQEEAGSQPRLCGSAAVADIDNLKLINDRFGHRAGDAAIRAVATAIRECIRADDLLFRWGGDEFLVLLIGVGEAEARSRLGRLNDRLRQAPLHGIDDLDGPRVDVSVSIGVAAFDSATSLDDVIALADEAMYDRKRQG